MKTEEELNQAIVKITMKITEKYPELMKSIEEMPATIPGNHNAEINSKSLRDYYDSLEAMLKKYTTDHISEKK
jgi:hypothetical protein